MKYNENHSLLKIGEVAKLNHISTDTLRYYDKIDLFKPAVKIHLNLVILVIGLV